MVKAIQHLYGDKEKVKLPMRCWERGKLCCRRKKKKRKILFQSWENPEEVITGENQNLYCKFIKMLV